MPTPTETGGTARVRAPAVYERARAQTASLVLHLGASVITTTAARYTLTDPSGTVLVDDEVASHGAASTFPLLATHLPSTLDFGEGYIAWWDLTWATGSGRFRQPVVMSKHAFHCPVTQADVNAKHPGLATLLRGTAATDSMQAFGDDALMEVVRRLLLEGKLPESMLDIDSLFDPIVALWLHRAFHHWYVATGEARFKDIAAAYKAEYAQAWGSVRSRMDTNQDGVADSDRRVGVVGIIRRDMATPHTYRTTGRGAM